MANRLTGCVGWVMVAIAAGGMVAMAVNLLQRNSFHSSSDNAVAREPDGNLSQPPELGPRHQLTYQQWVELLGREAAVVAKKSPKPLFVLAGDSLSLWFPHHLLPPEVTWLNQGISGETSAGLLRRLDLFDQTDPNIVFVMIGINDLIHGIGEETILANQQEIIQHLKHAHPNTKIVVQSILPHGGSRIQQKYAQADSIERQTAAKQPVWVSRLPQMPNDYVRKLNDRLAELAHQEAVNYLDLQPAFTDDQGNLRDDLSTDGLHLSVKGYAVWRSQLINYSQNAVHPPATQPTMQNQALR